VSARGSVVTIGNFDGVHLGHQEIVRVTLAQALEQSLDAVAFTFRPHPQSVLRPDRSPALLLTYDEKRELLLGLGLHRVVEQGFDLAFAKTQPAQFFEQILRGRENARAIVVGYDFTFGRERTGHIQVLQDLCTAAGVRLTVVAPQRLEQEVVSSSIVRGLLMQGHVGEAARLMGRPFFYRASVVRGEQRGRKLGFPTANLAVEGKLVLPHGVYATRAHVQGRQVLAVTHLGTRPTFHAGSEQVLAETHLLEGVWPLDSLYSAELKIEFVQRIREEKKFSGIPELSAQIEQDIRQVRQIFGVG